jgi:3-mercaptopyruvate sulfurtransferase SseA
LPNVPLKELSQRADADLLRELASRSRPIVTACQGGPMYALAAHALQRRGFRNVFFIDGGTPGWLAVGYTTIRRNMAKAPDPPVPARSVFRFLQRVPQVDEDKDDADQDDRAESKVLHLDHQRAKVGQHQSDGDDRSENLGQHG